MCGYVISINMIGGIKMKIIKKAASLAVSAAMLMQFTALAPIPAVSAAATETVIDGLTYVYVPDSPSKNECTIQLIYDDANKEVTKHDTIAIPEKIGNYTVTALGVDDKFIVKSTNKDSVHVETIKLPNTIKEIHQNAMIDDAVPLLKTLYVNIDNLDSVDQFAFGYLSAISEIYVYDKIDKAYYPTSEDLDKFRELVSIEGIQFQEMEDMLDCFMISKEEYTKNPKINGKLEFINAVSSTTYERKIGYMYAEEAVKKYDLKASNLSTVQKWDKISNIIKSNKRYSFLYPYTEDLKKASKCEILASTAMSVIGFHSGVCGGIAHSFEIMCRATFGNDIVDKDKDVLCVSVPGHALNAVRPEHRNDNSGYYLIDNTDNIFMQGYGKAVGEYAEIMDGYILGLNATDRDTIESNHDIKIEKAPNMFYEGVSYLYLRDETKGALHIELRDTNDKKNKFIDVDSYPVTSPTFYLEQLPHTKCGEGQPSGAPMNFFIEPNIYYELCISNSKGEAVFKADGENKFKLGNVEYVCTVKTIDYNTETPYGTFAPHTAYKNYFEVVIKQLTEDSKPDGYTTTTTVHKSTTTTTTTTTTTKATTTTTAKPTTTTTKKPTTTTTVKPTTTTTKKPSTTTTAKPTTTTAQKPTTTTTAKPTTTTIKPVTTTTAKKETPNLILPTGKEIEFTGTLQELINAGKASGGTLQYKIGEDGTWSEKIPTASEVGDYTVYYRVVGNEKYYGADTNADIAGRKNYAFPYCYDCQRDPAHPSKGDTCRAYQLKEPLIGDRVFDTKVKSDWTLEYVCAYKDFKEKSTYLEGLVERTREADSLSSSDDISIYELKDSGKHNSYGVVIAVSEGESELLYFGDTIRYGGGYILSKDALTENQTFKIDKDLKEINVETVKLSGKVNSKIFKNADVVYGDANCDGSVNMADAVLIMQSIANPSKYGVSGTDKAHITAQGQKNGDVSGNGDGITNKDALAIQKYKLALISKLPE